MLEKKRKFEEKQLHDLEEQASKVADRVVVVNYKEHMTERTFVFKKR